MKQYTHLIAIQHCQSQQILKEYLDIALVSSSYEIATVIFLDHTVVAFIQQQNSPVMEQTFNMINDFSIPLYTNKPTDSVFYAKPWQIQSLSYLKTHSQHHFIF